MNIIKNKQKIVTNKYSKPFKNVLNYDNISLKFWSLDSKKSTSLLTYSPHIAESSSNSIWNNTSYGFNKQINKHFPVLDTNVSNLIKSYFNMYSKNLEALNKVAETKFITRFKRLTINRIFTSKINVKHTYSDAVITVSVYNPERLHLIKKWKKIRSLMKLSSFYLSRKNYKLYLLRKKCFTNIKKNLIYINDINKILFYQNKNIYNTLPKNVDVFSNYLNEHLLSSIIKKTGLILYNQYNYLSLLKINKNKYNSVFLSKLLPVLQKIYNKNISLNIINLKSFYYNSDILTNLLVTKLKNKNIFIKNILKKLLNKVPLSYIVKSNPTSFLEWLYLYKNNDKYYVDNTHSDILLNKNSFSPIIKNMFINTHNHKKYVIQKTRNTKIIGLRLEAKGRLTKRITADRSVSLMEYKGTLKDVNSSVFGLKPFLVRGHEKDNLQYTFTTYKTRIGSYGIKGWISSY